MDAIIKYNSDDETQGKVRVLSDFDEGTLAALSGGYKFNYNSETGFYETPMLPISEAQTCLDNLES